VERNWRRRQNLIAASNSRYNNTEHFQFAIPTGGDYMLRVRWVEESRHRWRREISTKYGLAWSTGDTNVPEPTEFVLMMIAVYSERPPRHRSAHSSTGIYRSAKSLRSDSHRKIYGVFRALAFALLQP